MSDTHLATRDALAAALFAELSAYRGFAGWDELSAAARDKWLERADAILAALTEGGVA